MNARLLLLLATLGLAGCDLLIEDCVQVPGRDLLPGTYVLAGSGVAPDSPLHSYLPPEGAQDATLTISEQRDEVILRYRLNGNSIEDRWSVVESRKYW